MLEGFHNEAVRRGLLPKATPLTPETVFELVRDLPYKRAKSRAPGAIVSEWQGTCSGKHYLLKDLIQEMGIGSKLIMCTHRFDGENTAHFPQSLRDLTAKGPVPDVHTFLRLETSSGWTSTLPGRPKRRLWGCRSTESSKAASAWAWPAHP